MQASCWAITTRQFTPECTPNDVTVSFSLPRSHAIMLSVGGGNSLARCRKIIGQPRHHRDNNSATGKHIVSNQANISGDAQKVLVGIIRDPVLYAEVDDAGCCWPTPVVKYCDDAPTSKVGKNNENSENISGNLQLSIHY